MLRQPEPEVNRSKAQIARCLVEGNSIRATVRMTGASRNTIAKLLVELGTACALFRDETLRNLKATNVQCDEIWSLFGMKEANAPEAKQGEFGYGDVRTWTAINAYSKLMICWHLGMQDTEAGATFMEDVASRLANRVQMTTDDHMVYLRAALQAFGSDVDYGMLVKVYGNDYSAAHRYTPGVCTACDLKAKIGNPDMAKVSASFVEQANLTSRLSLRRFTRLTTALSRKLENHAAAIALHFASDNFCRPHQTWTKDAGFKTTPSMAAGVADYVWSMKELVGLLSN